MPRSSLYRIFACRLFQEELWESWNRLALLPTKYKTESQSRLWNVNFIVELPMASWGSNQNSLLGLPGGVRRDAVPQALLWEGGGLSGLTIVDFILPYILGCTQIIISTNFSSLSRINLFKKNLCLKPNNVSICF